MSDPKDPKREPGSFGRFLTKVLDASKELASDLGDQASEASASAKEKLQSAIERTDRESALANSDSLDRLRASDNPLIAMETRHVPAHVTQSMIFLAASAGVFQNATEISRFTRDLMDHDQAAVQQWLRRVFSPEQAREISIWMDTAPASEYAGGWAHRLHHGHDLSAMATLTQEHGFVGTAEWMNHVWLRDFWTPHGVPYLPAGSGTVYEWLIDLGLSPSTAMSVLSLNAAETASGVLIFFSAMRAKRVFGSISRARKYRSSLNQVVALVEEGSESEALRLVGEIETFAEKSGAEHLRLDLAGFCLSLSHKDNTERSAKWGDKAFMIAYDLCRSSASFPKVVDYHGGTKVSFQGLAAQIIVSSLSCRAQLQAPDLSNAADRVDFGIRRLLEVSVEQSKHSNIHIGGKALAGYRPYSALTNQIIALELSLALGSLYRTGTDPASIRAKMMQIINEIGLQGRPHAEFADRLGRNMETIYPVSAH